MKDDLAGCGVTVLRTVDNACTTKRWTWIPTLGEWLKIGYAAGAWFVPMEQPVADLAGLSVRSHLRAVDDRLGPPKLGFECPLCSRDGRYPVFVGFVPRQDLLAMLAAGERLMPPLAPAEVRRFVGVLGRLRELSAWEVGFASDLPRRRKPLTSGQAAKLRQIADVLRSRGLA